MKLETDLYQCPYCKVSAPKGHWRPRTWIRKHVEQCSRSKGI